MREAERGREREVSKRDGWNVEREERERERGGGEKRHEREMSEGAKDIKLLFHNALYNLPLYLSVTWLFEIQIQNLLHTFYNVSDSLILL